MASGFNDDVVNANLDNVFVFKTLNVTNEDNVLFRDDNAMQVFIKKMEVIDKILLILGLEDNTEGLFIDINSDLMGMFKDSFTVNTLRVILFQMTNINFRAAFMVLYGFYLPSDTKSNLSDKETQFIDQIKSKTLDTIRKEVLASIGKEKDNNPSKHQAPVLDINASKIKAVVLFLNSHKTKGMLEGFRKSESIRAELGKGLVGRAGKAKSGGGISKKVRTVKRKAKKVRNVTRKINKFNKLTNSNKKKINKSKKTN
jgi:hypothetical protein